MISQFQNRGRAYRCRHCNKIERKSRMVGHILKTHIPMDRVPFYCTLCSFRCDDKETLLAHIKKYARHRDEEMKRGTPDYSQILKRASNPLYVGEHDMVVLSREDSYRWHARHMLSQEDPLTESDDIFHDEDETTTVNGVSFPSWITPSRSIENTGSFSTLQNYKINSSLPSSLTTGELLTTSTLQPVQSTLNSLPCHSSLPAVIPPNCSSITNTYQQRENTLITIDPKDLASILENQQQHIIPPDTLNTPPVPMKSPSLNLSTPCQDEHILPGLLNLNQDDPLLQEARTITPTRKPTEEVPSNESREEGPTPKRRRTEESDNTTPSFSVIIDAITTGTKRIADAIDSNTRAVRCQEKTLEKVVGELSRIERKLANMERACQQRQTSESKEPKILTSKGKENKQMKSIVKKL